MSYSLRPPLTFSLLLILPCWIYPLPFFGSEVLAFCAPLVPDFLDRDDSFRVYARLWIESVLLP